jgi:hypothetical protein
MTRKIVVAIIAGLIALAVVLSIAACGSTPAKTPSSSVAPATKPSPQPGQTPQAAPQPSPPPAPSPVYPSTVALDGAVRPTEITVGMQNVIMNITWSEWSQNQAVGNGQQELNNCQPDCAQGQVTWEPVTITLSDAQPAEGSSGGYAFTQITEADQNGNGVNAQYGPEVSTFVENVNSGEDSSSGNPASPGTGQGPAPGDFLNAVAAAETNDLSNAPTSEFDYTGAGSVTVTVTCGDLYGSLVQGETASCTASDGVGDTASGTVTLYKTYAQDDGFDWSGPYVTGGTYDTPATPVPG